MITLNYINVIILIEVMLIYSSQYFINKKQKLMQLSNLKRANQIASLIEKANHELEELRSFPYQKENARVIISSTGKELILSSLNMPISAKELVELNITRIEKRIADLTQEAEKL